MPGTRPMVIITAAVTASARGEANICRLTWAPMSSELETRVTIIAAAVDSSSEGICATRPSPMVSKV